MDFLLRTEEIILKGKNRKFFERILIENIRKKFDSDLEFVKNLGGVYWIKIRNGNIKNKLVKIIGIKNFSQVEVFDSLEEVLENLKIEKVKTFKVKVQRGDKDYPLTSVEIAQKVGEFIKEKFKLQIDFQNPDLIIYLYYKNKKFFLAHQKIECFGGLPVGSSGKGLVFLSAGFDSPVASFLAMKRGLKVYFLHFHSYPQTSKESLEKVTKLVGILDEYNLGSKLYLMNILELQKFYYNNVPHKFLVIFYRRSMFRLAEKLAKELKIDCLITGESLGQVASQTIENLKVISSGISTFIFRPLLGFNKSEIIDLAKKIGTYEISLLKGDDCCSLFVPKKVETKAKLDEILEIEEKYKKEIAELEEKIYNQKELVNSQLVNY